MELSGYFKSIIDQDPAPVVICDTDHVIVYMNPAACVRYGQYGGASLTGRSLLACHNEESRQTIARVLEWFRVCRDNNCVHTFYNEKENKDVYMIALRDEQQNLIGYYEKHVFRDRDMTPLYHMP